MVRAGAAFDFGAPDGTALGACGRGGADALFGLGGLGAGGSPDLQARLGLVPADPRLPALLGDLFLHGGWLQLLATLLFVAAHPEILAALEPVDAVVIFDEDTPDDIIKAVQPDVLVKGADWAEDAIVGRDTVEARGGRVVRIAVEEGFSTSDIVWKIKALP